MSIATTISASATAVIAAGLLAVGGIALTSAANDTPAETIATVAPADPNLAPAGGGLAVEEEAAAAAEVERLEAEAKAKAEAERLAAEEAARLAAEEAARQATAEAYVEPEPYVEPAPEPPAPAPAPEAPPAGPDPGAVPHTICEVLADGTEVPCQ